MSFCVVITAGGRREIFREDLTEAEAESIAAHPSLSGSAPRVAPMFAR
jgi:hypothetical protein